MKSPRRAPPGEVFPEGPLPLARQRHDTRADRERDASSHERGLDEEGLLEGPLERGGQEAHVGALAAQEPVERPPREEDREEERVAVGGPLDPQAAPLEERLELTRATRTQ